VVGGVAVAPRLLQEFVTTLCRLDVGLSEEQVYELMRSLDVNNDASIDFDEFAAVRCCYSPPPRT
jgi:Ca2+-binding EF-hand superfamily protein